MKKRYRIALVIGLCLCGNALAIAGAAGQEVYATPEQAIDAFIAANRIDDFGALSRILGPGSEKLVRSGDAVADRGHRARFVAAYDSGHRIEFAGDSKAVLIVGPRDWPMPIPLVRGDTGWRFDAPAAEQEVLNRRIGHNELSVIEVCRAYVEAQREYAARIALPGHPREYAQRFASHPGRRDGLYWAATQGEPPSPLGPMVAQAETSGYQTGPLGGIPEPYHGYYFRILTRQGPHAPGGAKSFLVEGRLTEGFALIAYPALYGDSGVMTFIVSQDGIVYEKNLGAKTHAIARQIEAYDPDASWHAP